MLNGGVRKSDGICLQQNVHGGGGGDAARASFNNGNNPQIRLSVVIVIKIMRIKSIVSSVSLKTNIYANQFTNESLNQSIQGVPYLRPSPTFSFERLGVVVNAIWYTLLG